VNFKKALAWGVHLYTALGLIAAAGIAVLIVQGDAESFRLAFLLMVTATAIDSTDGWLARRVGVKELTPGFDGRRLDDLVDFQTYTTLPLLLIWRAELVGAENQWWLLVPLLASAYGFCQTEAKTDDHYFLGFPSYWNVVALYLYLWRLPEMWALGIIIFLALLTFVPSRYLYTSYGGHFSLVTNLFCISWAILLVVILWQWPNVPRTWLLASLSFPAYYLGLSWLISLRYWHKAARVED
jgi:phosphatidylcholine synthase